MVSNLLFLWCSLFDSGIFGRYKEGFLLLMSKTLDLVMLKFICWDPREDFEDCRCRAFWLRRLAFLLFAEMFESGLFLFVMRGLAALLGIYGEFSCKRAILVKKQIWDI